MNVKELIEKLSNVPGEVEVYVRYETYASRAIVDVTTDMPDDDCGYIELVAEDL